MHTIYHTEAIVVRSEPVGEANKRVWLFTKELGLIVAVVQGVRKPGAKLQSHITDYSIVMADLIKGKNAWRLVSASVLDVPLKGKERAPTARALVRSIAFLERFLIGEGPHEELFQHIADGMTLVKEKDIDARAFDALSLWRILVLLGYSAVESENEKLFTLPLIDAMSLLTDSKIKELIKNATDAITNSHL